MLNTSIFKNLICGLFCSLLISMIAQLTCAQSSNDKNALDPRKDNPNQYEEFERRLNAILKTRRDEEKEFVKQVIEQVKEDKLPVKLIDTSFEWVRNKRPYTDHPFYYFEPVLRLHAAELGVQDEVPPFDYSKVQISGIRAPGQQLNASAPTERQRNSLLSRFFRFPGIFSSN